MLQHRLARIASLLAALTASSATSVARAEPSVSGGGPQAPDHYGYVFKDEILDAGLFGPKDARIEIVSRRPRGTLIRPRTEFVMELLKTVESF
jgi:hypothetical protein